MVENNGQSASVCIAGIGPWGLRMAGKVAGQITGVDHIGLVLDEYEGSPPESLIGFDLSGGVDGRKSGLILCLKRLKRYDFVLLLASFDAGLKDTLEFFCCEARRRLIKLILVMPEPQNGNGGRCRLQRNRDGEVRDIEAAVPQAVLRFSDYLHSLVIVSDESFPPLAPGVHGLLHKGERSDYIVQDIVGKLAYIIARTPRNRRWFTAIDVTWKGATRCGTGMAAGPGRAVAAAEEAFSNLKRQGVLPDNIDGILCAITVPSGPNTAEVDTIIRHAASLVDIDTPVKGCVVVDEGLPDDGIVVTLMASEKLWRDVTSMRRCCPDTWATLTDESLRHIPAFERKRWFVKFNNRSGREAS